MSFDALLSECQPGADAAGLFARTWAVWGANARTFTSDPVASVASIKAAKAVFDFLATQPLEEKPLSKIQLCLTQIGSLLVVAEPEPVPAKAKPAKAPPAAKPEPKSSAYAKGNVAPTPDALPPPSMLFGAATRSPPAAPMAAAPSARPG